MTIDYTEFDELETKDLDEEDDENLDELQEHK